MRKHGRRDSNHADIIKELRKVPGMEVLDIADLGGGAGDIIVGYQRRNLMFEIKDPAKPPSARELTSDEKKFHRRWPGQINVAETVWDILRAFSLVA